MTPNLHFHLNIHLSFYRLRSGEDAEYVLRRTVILIISFINCSIAIREANKAAQKAEYYINWHLDKIPEDKREMLKCFYTTRMNAVRMEILMRLGDNDSAFQRVGQMFDAFARLPASFRRLCSGNCKVSSNALPRCNVFL